MVCFDIYKIIIYIDGRIKDVIDKYIIYEIYCN